MNEITNGDFVDLNKKGNHTLENDKENDDFVVVIHLENQVNANEEHLYKKKLFE